MRDKKILWEELCTIKTASQDLVWCFCGDFNAIRSKSERKGVKDRGDKSSEITGFDRFIDSNFLLELPIVGKKYTWFKPNGSSKSELDRIFVSKE